MHILVLLWLCVGSALAVDNGLGLTPQMAWNSWNVFECNINETIIKAVANAIVKSGLADAGYKYVNMDDCWAYARNASGFIEPDPTDFPSGIKALADYVHSLGLKFGLYSDAGNETCAGRPGSLGYEKQDAEQYAAWGVDYLKYDNCHSEGIPDLPRYTAMSKALNATGRPIFFSLCNWAVTTAFWGPDVGNSWRTTADILPWWDSMTNNIDQNNVAQPYAAPGGWNDPDMLEVGNVGLTLDENIAHFSLWALTKAPLILGNDVTQLTPDVFNIISNSEVIAVNQDTLGIQGSIIKRTPAQDPNIYGNIIYADTCNNSAAQQFAYNATSGNLESVLIPGQCIGQFIPWWACNYDPYMGAALYLQPCNVNCKGKMQNWTFSDNAVLTRFNADAPLCIQIGGQSAADIYLWNCSGASNQTWEFSNGYIRNPNGKCITVSAGPEVWAAPMSDGSFATVLFNRANLTLDVTVDFNDFGLTSASVRDLWAHKDQGVFTDSYTTSVNAHGAAMLRLSQG